MRRRTVGYVIRYNKIYDNAQKGYTQILMSGLDERKYTVLISSDGDVSYDLTPEKPVKKSCAKGAGRGNSRSRKKTAAEDERENAV